jgi:alkanesulfonate monooxygenase SsuD/methylene tetrahydromethanopterin reductase-like flavin-dependent oxidoreductase (luciferase family)
VAGRVGDGVIIQLADPAIIEWTMATARKAAEEVGRDPSELRCLVCAPSKVSDDIAAARDEVRWFPAMVGNHVADIVRVHGETSDIPRELTDYIKGRDAYDYKDHSRVGAAHGSFVPDEICDRFCVIGSAAQCVEKLRGLEAIGVDEWIVYLMTEGQDETLEAYGSEIIPAVNS